MNQPFMPYEWSESLPDREPTPFLAYPVLRPWWLRWLGRYRIVKIWEPPKIYSSARK